MKKTVRMLKVRIIDCYNPNNCWYSEKIGEELWVAEDIDGNLFYDDLLPIKKLDVELLISINDFEANMGWGFLFGSLIVGICLVSLFTKGFNIFPISIILLQLVRFGFYIYFYRNYREL